MFDRMRNAKVCLKIGLKTEFCQIRMKSEVIEKTGFNTKYGQFEYFVEPLRAFNTKETFTNLMNEVSHECMDEFVMIYISGLLIFSNDK